MGVQFPLCDRPPHLPLYTPVKGDNRVTWNVEVQAGGTQASLLVLNQSQETATTHPHHAWTRSGEVLVWRPSGYGMVKTLSCEVNHRHKIISTDVPVSATIAGRGRSSNNLIVLKEMGYMVVTICFQ